MKRKVGTRKKNHGMYRSGLEKRFAEETPRKAFDYEPFSVGYTTYRKYLPDFVQGAILIECKGFFRAGDTAKYKAIRDSLDGQYEVVFYLSDPNKKVRKGSKLTMGQWCEKEGFACFAADQTEELMRYVNSRGTN